ncbi:hypothetical protein DFP72DRAFT_1075697 [Ephemerocybe angulata]|uniref:Uncharacterized protein n=1 Tax=Ephemerocybe angulata TaxID=980116 RepID=A0A8H6HIN4_9AGAR|nr:hypothetical protein DFP72DRAFT_1075697 [Tulosesus angulatus]
MPSTTPRPSCSTLCDVALPLLPSPDFFRGPLIRRLALLNPPSTPTVLKDRHRQREHWRAPLAAATTEDHASTTAKANPVASTNSRCRSSSMTNTHQPCRIQGPSSPPSPVSLSRAGLVVKTDLVTPSFGLRPSFWNWVNIEGRAHGGRSLAVDVTSGPEFGDADVAAWSSSPAVALGFCRTVRHREPPTAANGAVGFGVMVRVCGRRSVIGFRAGDGDGADRIPVSRVTMPAARASRLPQCGEGVVGFGALSACVDGSRALCLEREGLRSATAVNTLPNLQFPSAIFESLYGPCTCRRVDPCLPTKDARSRRIAGRSEGGRMANASAGPGVLSRFKPIMSCTSRDAQCLRMREKPVWVSTSVAPIEPPNSAVLVAGLAIVVGDSRR